MTQQQMLQYDLMIIIIFDSVFFSLCGVTLEITSTCGHQARIIITSLFSVVSAVHMAEVFVYGTLKKGQPNFFRMLDADKGQAEFVANARTVERYPLVIATKYNIPFLLNVPEKGQRVHGEIYRVDEKMLEFLDWFEGCPKMYQRTKVQVEVQDGENTAKPGSIMEVFVYSTTTYEPDWLQKPTYESYEAYGDHGLHYVDRDHRSPE